MPTVPKLPQVEARPLSPNYQSGRGVTGEAFGSGIGQALQGLGRAINETSEPVARMALQLSAEDNERQAKDLDNQYSTFLRDKTMGENGFYSQKGENAINAAPQFQEDIEKFRQDLLAKAPNRHVRNMFDLSSQSRLSTALDKAQSYVMQERQVAKLATAETRIYEATQDAAAAYNDPKVLAQSQAIIEHEVSAIAEINGWSDEITNSKISTERTKMYSSAITAAIKNNQLSIARDLFEKVKTSLDGEEQANLSKLLTEQNLLGKSQKAADEIIASTGDYTQQLEKARTISDPLERAQVEDLIMERASRAGQIYNLNRLLSTQERQSTVQKESDRIMSLPGTSEQKMAAARSIQDPEIRNLVENDVGNRITEAATIERADQARIFSQASRSINQGETLNNWAIQNPEAYLALSGNLEAISDLRTAEKAVAEGKLFSDVTDGETLGKLQRLSAVELSRTDPETYRYKLTKEEYTRLSNMVASAQASIQRTRENYSIYERGESVLRDTVPRSWNWNSEKQSTSDREAQSQILNEMNNFIYGYTSEGKLPTIKDIQEEANRLITIAEQFKANSNKSYMGNFLDWWNDAPAQLPLQIQLMSPEDRANLRVSYDSITPSSRDAVASKFRERGITPTNDLIEQFFGAQLVRDYTRQRKLMGMIDTSNITESYVKKVSKVESNNRPDAKAKTSSATGLFQFTRSSWLDAISSLAPELQTGRTEQEILDLRKDAGVSTEVFKRFSARNQNTLEAAGIPSTDANMYLAHFLGANGAKKVLSAPDDASLDSILGPKVIKANYFLNGKNVAWIKSWSSKKMV